MAVRSRSREHESVPQLAAAKGRTGLEPGPLASWIYWGSAAGAVGLMLYLGWIA